MSDEQQIAVKHPVFLTGEDGEPIWIKADVFANHSEALAAYNNNFGAGWSIKTPISGTVEMELVGAEESPWGDDPEWCKQVAEAGPNTASYWRFDV